MKLYDVPQINGQLYLRDNTDLWGFLQNGVYEPEETELIKKLVKPDDVCLDIGANIGYYTVLMAKQSKEVTAIEAEWTNCIILDDNISINNLDNVITMWSIVGDHKGYETLHLCEASHGMHRIFPSKHCKGEQKKVPMKKLDDEMDDDITFIKMDIEGSELGALVGMKRILTNNDIKMVMEFHPPSIIESGANPKYIYDFLTELKYDIRLVPKIDESISYEDLYAATNNESGGQNILCEKK